ncbi:hypothetical protein L218DRAFT_177923 [Marasmius fiardii PR-910]|nr:hypothetical protein L218DRAFT_177923 [Marasmius fiardii PR-910]
MEPGGGTNTAQNDRHASNRSERYCKIRSKVDGFAEASKMLSLSHQLILFQAAPVIAFKAVVTLELKRRENDDKVIFLLVKVQGLMEALVQLRAIPSGKRTEDQLCTVEEALASLCVEIEKDIRECGNLCDTFSKKPFLVKLLKGPIYDIRLEEMGKKLDERQKELDHALHRFTALGIQSTNDALNSAQYEISMLLLLQMLQSSVEKEFLSIIDLKGGPRKCMEDEDVLVELIQIQRSLTRESHSPDVVESSITREPLHMQAPHELSGHPEISSPISFYRGMYDSRHTSRRPTVEIPVTRDHHSDPARSAQRAYSNVGVHGFRRRARSFLISEGYFSDPARPYRSPYHVSAPPESHSHYRPRNRYVYNSHRRKPFGTEVKQLMEELARDIDKEVERNRATFSRKLEEQQRQLLAIERAVVIQGDRVVQEVHRGPHDRIHDEELRSIWREMGWKLVVPTVEFVRTLHDYFVSQHKDMQILNDHFSHPPGPDSTPEDEMVALSKALTAAKQRSDEKWALKSLHFMNLQPISEAFDADCSGYVSVWEANQMLSLRPNGWSLLQWLAYWASGRHHTITEYSSKINEILANMHLLLRQKVLPVNRHTVNHYLHYGMKTLDRVLATTIPCTNAPGGELARRVSRYTKNEEERMEHVLKALHYEIDGSDTIELIASRYQIERNFFPLVYLLLKRHLSVIRLACDVPLDVREMDTATNSLRTIFKAVKDRVLTLEGELLPLPVFKVRVFTVISHVSRWLDFLSLEKFRLWNVLRGVHKT